MSTFQERVKKLAGQLGGAQVLADKSGLSRRTIGSYMAGDTDPKRADLVALANAAGVGVEWLAVGTGAVANSAEQREVRYEVTAAENCVYFPLGDNRSMISPPIPAPKGGDNVDVLAISGRWILSELHSKPTDLVVAHVPGDSMSPFLRPGDVVLLDSSDVTVTREGVYFIRMDGTVVVKQLQRLPGGVVKVSSRNPEYEAFTVKMDEVRSHDEFSIMGRVACALVRF